MAEITNEINFNREIPKLFIIKFMWNKNACWSLFFLFIQQLIVASSTLWISSLSFAVAENKEYGLYLSLFILSLFIVYIPYIVSTYHLGMSRSKVFKKYVELFSKNYQLIPTLRMEQKFRSEQEPWLINESQKTIDEAHHVFYDGISITLNTLLNIGALCIAVDSHLLIGYSISILILPFVLKAMRRPLERQALLAQSNSKSLTQILISGWDNITIGNSYNFSIWWDNFEKRWNNYKTSLVKLIFLKDGSSSLTMTLLMFPIIINIIWLFYLNSNNLFVLAVLVATLPRQIQILQHLHLFSSYVIQWHGLRSKLNELLLSIQKSEQANYGNRHDNRIEWNAISITENNKTLDIDSLDNFLKIINLNQQIGRITIQGKNGSGKTSIMNLLKQSLGDKAIYLPTNSQLLFENTLESTLSTGQQFKVRFDEVLNYLLTRINLKPQVILLDEWDANLDMENLKIISDKIDILAKQALVVEIRHKLKIVESVD